MGRGGWGEEGGGKEEVKQPRQEVRKMNME